MWTLQKCHHLLRQVLQAVNLIYRWSQVQCISWTAVMIRGVSLFWLIFLTLCLCRHPGKLEVKRPTNHPTKQTKKAKKATRVKKRKNNPHSFYYILPLSVNWFPCCILNSELNDIYHFPKFNSLQDKGRGKRGNKPLVVTESMDLLQSFRTVQLSGVYHGSQWSNTSRLLRWYLRIKQII